MTLLIFNLYAGESVKRLMFYSGEANQLQGDIPEKSISRLFSKLKALQNQIDSALKREKEKDARLLPQDAKSLEEILHIQQVTTVYFVH